MMGPTAANARIRLTWKVVPIKNVLEYLEQTARLHPVRPACVEETRACCYQELARSSQAVGSALSHCIRPREPVAVYLEKSAAALFALFGVVYAKHSSYPCLHRYSGVRCSLGRNFPE